MKIGCYQCHGREGQGSTCTGPRLNQNPITYTRFVSYIRKPTGEMPPYTAKVVSEQQAADIFAFLQSLPKPPAGGEHSVVEAVTARHLGPAGSDGVRFDEQFEMRGLHMAFARALMMSSNAEVSSRISKPCSPRSR